MDRLVSLHDREIIGAFLRRNAPPQIYAHLSPGASEALAAHYDRESHGLYDKMLLALTEGAIDRDEYDRALPDRQRSTLY